MRSGAGRAEARRAQRDALRVILPTELERDLLRAVLWQGAAGRDAWRRWHERVGDPALAFERQHAGLKGLVPLLHVAVGRNGVDVPPTFATYLRAAYFREELRGNAYRRILGRVLAAFAAADIRPLVLKGCALAEAIYDDPKSRHAHGIELLVRRPQADRAAAALRSLGFGPAGGGRLGKGESASSWRHGSGLPLQLRVRLLGPRIYAVSDDELWSRSVPLALADTAAHTLGREHALLHVCASAATSADRSTLRWACDAWLLLRRSDGFDWPVFLDAVDAAQLALPLSMILRFVAEELAAPVPPEALATLDAQAARIDDLGHEVALLCALVGAHARMRRTLLATRSWSSRLAVLRPLLAPSPAVVRAIAGEVAAWSLPLYYATRPTRYVARRLRRLGPAGPMRA